MHTAKWDYDDKRTEIGLRDDGVRLTNSKYCTTSLKAREYRPQKADTTVINSCSIQRWVQLKRGRRVCCYCLAIYILKIRVCHQNVHIQGRQIFRSSGFVVEWCWKLLCLPRVPLSELRLVPTTRKHAHTPIHWHAPFSVWQVPCSIRHIQESH